MNAWLRVEVSTLYQPCVVTVSASNNVSPDVHIVADPAQLGAHVPADLLAAVPTLSGVVFENTPAGKQPVSGVRVEVDMLWGLGDVRRDHAHGFGRPLSPLWSCW
jgi:hypothetical protein